MDSEPDTPPAARRGPSSSRSAAARQGSAARTPSAASGKKPTPPAKKSATGAAAAKSAGKPVTPKPGTPKPPSQKSPAASGTSPSKAASPGSTTRTPPRRVTRPGSSAETSRDHGTDAAAAPADDRRVLTNPFNSAAIPTIGSKAAPPAPVEEPPVEEASLVEEGVERPEDLRPEPEPEPKPAPEPEPEPEPEPSPELSPEQSHADAPPAPPPAIGHTGPLARRPNARPTSSDRPARSGAEIALAVSGLTKRFGSKVAVDAIDLEVPSGSFFGFVGPNGAGKTTTLSMITGLLRPDSGSIAVYDVDVWKNAAIAKRALGVLPDRLRLFDRLTGEEFLHHAGALRGLDRATITRRSADLVTAFGLDHSVRRLVSDYSAGMVKKIAIAAAMIHSPRLLVLDEPFESVDPVSAQVVIGILQKFTAAGGTVLLSSHSMELIERVCDSVAIIADGRMLAAGPLAEVLDGRSLEQRFVELAGGATAVEGMEWLQSFSD